MAVSWPATLQDKLNQESFSVELGDTVLRSDMDIGPAKVRRRTTRPIDVYTCSINLYQTDYSTFMTFFNTYINGGVTPFEFVDPFSGNLTEFRFVGTPTVSPLGSAGWFRITMKWEKLS